MHGNYFVFTRAAVRLTCLLSSLAILGCAGRPAQATGGVVNGVKANAIVAQDGSGDFKTVQSALDAMPHDNAAPYVIYIKPGIYHEKISVAQDQPYVHLAGASADSTILTYGDYARMKGPDGQEIGTGKTFSLEIKGHDFQADHLTFENSAAPRSVVAQAVAVAVNADRSVFRHCHFLANQDTLYANSGRQFYQDCLIRGDVDFIFGNAAAVFDHCDIQSVGKGYVTAQSRIDPSQPTGYVFYECSLSGTAPAGSVTLGRPWRDDARVVYLGCALGPQISSLGWHDWGKLNLNREQTAFYGEYGDTTASGSPLDVSQRVAWSHQLTAAQAAPFVPATFLKGDDGWNPGAPAVLPAPGDMAGYPLTTPVAVAPATLVSPPASDAALTPTPNIPLPTIPTRTFDITHYGAVGDGKTLNTAAIGKALAACAAAGGGTVLVPPGRFLTGPLTLTSSLNFHVASGATLLLSDNTQDYPVVRNRFQNCISADSVHDLAITGHGTIDGQGAMWWANYVKQGPHRPFLIQITRCQRLLVQDITLTNSPMFHLVPQRCQDVRIEHIHIIAPDTAKNTDGLDPSGWNFLITGCTFNVGDDCIALKPSARIQDDQPACRNFTITNCQFLHGHGLSVGGQTPGGLDGLVVRDCTFHGTDAGIRLKASRGAGGLVQNLTYENLTMIGVKNVLDISSYYNGNSPGGGGHSATTDTAQPVTATTPIWQNIQIRNVTATDCRSAGRIIGLPEMPVKNVTLTDVNITAATGLQVIHARGITFVNSHITAQAGAPVMVLDAQVTGVATTAQR